MQITIQRDGRILLEEHNEENRFLDPSDPYALTMVMRSHTVFEDGLTLRQLMKAIRPWKEAFGSAGWMNFDAWFSEIDRTHLSQVTTDPDESKDPLASLEIYNIVTLDRPNEGHLELHSYWDFHAYYQTPVEADGAVWKTCSVSFLPARAYANLPIRINYKAKVHDRQADYLEGRRPVLSAERPGIYSHIETNSSFFDIVVLGLLDQISFHGDPEETEERGDALFETVASLREKLEGNNEESDQPENDNDTPANETVSMTMDEFYEELGLAQIGRRFDAASTLHNSLKTVSADDTALAEKLDITLIGLAELKAGINAHMTINALDRAAKIVADHTTPTVPDKTNLTVTAAFSAVRSDPITALKDAIAGHYRFKPLVCLLIIVGLINQVLHGGFIGAGMISKNHAWEYLGRGLLGSVLATITLLTGATLAKLLLHRSDKQKP
jgi:hypothetical protein